MSIFHKISASCLAALIAGAGLAGCGSSGPSNDQGTSYLGLGFFQNVDGDPVPIGGIESTLNSENPVARVAGSVDGRADVFLMGTENRLSTQYIRQTRFDCNYEVPGASIQIPGSSTISGVVLSPANFGDGDKVPTIAQPNPGVNIDDGGRAQFWFSVINIVPSDIYSFLNNNINSLPQLPFVMNASCVAVGVTQAGDILTTNASSIPVYFYDEADVVSNNPVTGTSVTPTSFVGESSADLGAQEFPSTTNDNTGSVETDEFLF